jgi:hypothetical protein
MAHPPTTRTLLKKALGLAAITGTLSFMACLAAPDEPNKGSNEDPLKCRAGEQLFNGACRQSCRETKDCSGGLSCMVVGADTSICIDYTHCAYLESDTSCDQVSGGGYGYDGYGYGYGTITTYALDAYSTASPESEGEIGYSYQGAGCIGNAAWATIEPSGNPQCGVGHPVNRCRPTAQGCAIVTSTTTDIADP